MSLWYLTRDNRRTNKETPRIALSSTAWILITAPGSLEALHSYMVNVLAAGVLAFAEIVRRANYKLRGTAYAWTSGRAAGLSCWAVDDLLHIGVSTNYREEEEQSESEECTLKSHSDLEISLSATFWGNSLKQFAESACCSLQVLLPRLVCNDYIYFSWQ